MDGLRSISQPPSPCWKAFGRNCRGRTLPTRPAGHQSTDPPPLWRVRHERGETDQTADEADAAFQTAVETARDADLVIMVLGEKADMAGEFASRGSLDLPGRQEELLKAVNALGKPVVLVLLNGRPLSINWAAEHVPCHPGSLEPGTEGGHAVADILFGDVNPGGKLPVTFPRSGGPHRRYYAATHLPERVPAIGPRYWDSRRRPFTPLALD